MLRTKELGARTLGFHLPVLPHRENPSMCASVSLSVEWLQEGPPTRAGKLCEFPVEFSSRLDLAVFGCECQDS